MLGDTSCTAELRKLIARCVSSDPQTYNNVFLGRANSDYCNWILDKENWGGNTDDNNNCIYNKILDCDWFPVHLFVV